MKRNQKLQPKRLILAATLFVMIALVGCGAQAKQETLAPKVQTSVQFSWLHTIEFTGFYEAARQGYYADENLEVRLDGGGFDSNGMYIDPIQRVVDGEDDFGVAGADVILQARSEGKPVVAVAVIYQRSPMVLISLAEKNIVHPQDLVGRHVATQPEGSTVDIVYRALLESQEIDRSQIKETPRTDYTIAPLFDKEIDVLPGFITNDGVKARMNSDVNFILPSDYGIDIYSNAIFTTETIIKDNPNLVEAFVRATTRGTQWAFDNPEEAAQYILDTYGEDMSPDMKTAQQPGMQASLPLLNPAGSRPGMMTDQAWQQVHQILLDQGILKEPLDINAAYTLSFLEKVYSE